MVFLKCLSCKLYMNSNHYFFTFIHPLLRGVETPGGQQAQDLARPSGLFFCAGCTSLHIFILLFLLSSPVYLSYLILAVHMRKCLGKQSCTSSTFPLATLNGTCFLRSVKTMKIVNRVLLTVSRASLSVSGQLILNCISKFNILSVMFSNFPSAVLLWTCFLPKCLNKFQNLL